MFFGLFSQSSVCSTGSQQGLLRKVPVTPVSIPGPVQTAVSSGSKPNGGLLKKTAPGPAGAPVADNEVTASFHAKAGTTRTEPLVSFSRSPQLWSEMRRHQILREELRQRRKHLEYLIAEHQRRSGQTDSPQHNRESLGSPSHTVSRDERYEIFPWSFCNNGTNVAVIRSGFFGVCI